MTRYLPAFLMTAFFLLPGVSEDIDCRLSPATPPLERAGVPSFDREIPEAVRHRDGLAILPAKPFRWIHSSPENQPISLVIDIDGESFDSAVLTIWNWHNRPLFRRELAADESHRLELHCEGRGVYQVLLDGCVSGQFRKRLVRSIAVTEDLNSVRETWRKDEFFLGICAFPGRYHWSFRGEPTLPEGIYAHEARELEAESLARLGFQVVRTDESMEMGTPTRDTDGRYRFDFRRMDRAVGAYTSRGLELALQLMNAPDWAIHEKYAKETENRWRFPRREEPQRHYLRALLERYGKHARFVQVFNEPDQVAFWRGTPGEYVEQFLYSRDEIRRLAGELPIANGGYSLVDPERTAFFAEHLKGKIDLVAYHSHGNLPDLMEDLETVRRIHRDAGYPSPRYINTEMGADGWRLDQERRKGQIVPQKTLFCWVTGHEGVLLFGGRMTLGPRRTNQDFGFLDHHFCPRFVYGSMASLVATLSGASFHSVVHQSEETFVYRFERGDETILAAFTLKETGEVEILSDAASPVLVDEMGNRRSIESGRNIKLELSPYPRYLILKNVSEIRVPE